MKRVFDIVFSLLLMILFFPLMLMTAFIIYIKIGKSVFFKQVRPGLNEQLFIIYKFKTMSDERDKNGEFLSDSKRLSSTGKLIRKMSLDELPQLFNVLKGEMSFIGPRPLLVEYLKLYDSKQKRRHSVKPGISGWAQVNGRNAISWEQKFEYDIWYVDNQSFLFDMKIMWMTLLKVIKRSDVNSDSSVSMEKFKGSDK